METGWAIWLCVDPVGEWEYKPAKHRAAPYACYELAISRTKKAIAYNGRQPREYLRNRAKQSPTTLSHVVGR